MEYKLTWEGETGLIKAALTADGEVIATTEHLETEADVEAWGREQAASHKDATEPPQEAVPVSGESSFEL